jgi:uncharacterized membrane protein YGL010W
MLLINRKPLRLFLYADASIRVKMIHIVTTCLPDAMYIRTAYVDKVNCKLFYIRVKEMPHCMLFTSMVKLAHLYMVNGVIRHVASFWSSGSQSALVVSSFK